MRKILALLLLAGLAGWWLLSRRRVSPREATIGYDDGSALVLDEETPELDGLVAAAREALRA
jgi:hypothetical protein